jgi:hypothetical protein
MLVVKNRKESKKKGTTPNSSYPIGFMNRFSNAEEMMSANQPLKQIDRMIHSFGTYWELRTGS